MGVGRESMIDKLLRKLQLFCTGKTKNKGICIWDNIAMKIDDVRIWLKYRK